MEEVAEQLQQMWNDEAQISMQLDGDEDNGIEFEDAEIIGDDASDDVEYDEFVNAYAPVPVPYTNCGKPGDLVTVESISSTIWPPALGETGTVLVNLLVNQEITNGTATVVVSLDGFPVLNNQAPISQFLTLPVAQGPASLSHDITLPSSSPIHGSINVQLSAVNQDNAELFCVGLAFTI